MVCMVAWWVGQQTIDPIDSDAGRMHCMGLAARALARLVSVCHSEVRTGTHAHVARVVVNAFARPGRTFGGRPGDCC